MRDKMTVGEMAQFIAEVVFANRETVLEALQEDDMDILRDEIFEGLI